MKLALWFATKTCMVRVVVAILSLSVSIGVVGCQVGRMATSINNDSHVPSLQFQMVPKQWEPRLDAKAVEVSAESEEVDITAGKQTTEKMRKVQ